jgi:hypothetical protein
MTRKSMVVPAIFAALLSAFLQLGLSQDFKRTYVLSSGGEIRIGNISGDVKVTGYNGNSIEVIAHKKGRERNLIEIGDFSFGNRIDLRSYYPQMRGGDASVEFEVRVPGTVEYDFSRLWSVSGNVKVSNVSGHLRADSTSGNVEIFDVNGLVSGWTVSGNVTAEISRNQDSGNMSFSSISGNVNVRAPADLDAAVEMSSLSGSLKTDFPIETQERRYGPGRSARGKLGSGRQSLRINTVSGHVSLIRR